MSLSKDSYQVHRDLYLEILKKAEKEADKALVQLIAEKMKKTTPQPSVTKDGCQVFEFPSAVQMTAEQESECLFYKDGQFWQDLSQFMAVLTVCLGFFIFFCNLITARIVG